MASGILQRISPSKTPHTPTSPSVFTQITPTSQIQQGFSFFTCCLTQRGREGRVYLLMDLQPPGNYPKCTPNITKLWLTSDTRGMPAETKMSVYSRPSWLPFFPFTQTEDGSIKFAGTITTERLKQIGHWNSRDNGTRLLSATTGCWMQKERKSRHNLSLEQHLVSDQCDTHIYSSPFNRCFSFRQLENDAWPHRVHREEKDVRWVRYVSNCVYKSSNE